MKQRKRIDHWIDGDSGMFTDGNYFRLARVHAPEKHQFGGERATRRAAGMSGQSSGNVSVQVVGQSYGSINNRMLRRGYSSKGR